MNKYIMAILISVGIIPVQGLAKGDNFNLKNNTDQDITFEVISKGNPGKTRFIKANKSLAMNVEDTLSQINITQGKNLYEFGLEPSSAKTTYYMKFYMTGGRGQLAPQEGDILKRSTEKYSLKNNIKDNQIRQQLRF